MHTQFDGGACIKLVLIVVQNIILNALFKATIPRSIKVNQTTMGFTVWNKLYFYVASKLTW